MIDKWTNGPSPWRHGNFKQNKFKIFIIGSFFAEYKSQLLDSSDTVTVVARERFRLCNGGGTMKAKRRTVKDRWGFASYNSPAVGKIRSVRRAINVLNLSDQRPTWRAPNYRVFGQTPPVVPSARDETETARWVISRNPCMTQGRSAGGWPVCDENHPNDIRAISSTLPCRRRLVQNKRGLRERREEQQEEERVMSHCLTSPHFCYDGPSSFRLEHSV